MLKCRKFYYANPTAVSVQDYTGSMVHVAFRIAHAHIARRVRVPADDLPSQKLVPLPPIASMKLLQTEYIFEET